MSIPIHQYHYHYLYTYDHNGPSKLTDTKIVKDVDTGVSIFHHHIYTILLLSKSYDNTSISGNIYEIDDKHEYEIDDKQEAVDALLSLHHTNNIDCNMEKPLNIEKPVIIKKNSFHIEIGRGVYHPTQPGLKGTIINHYKRKGRQLRWRVEWDNGSKELFYTKDIKPLLI